MARTAAECEAMIAACERAGVPLFVAYYRRATPRFTTVQRLLADGAIGTPRAVTVRHLQPAPSSPDGVLPWRLRPEVSGGGLFVDLGSHTLDLLDHLLGPVTHCSGVATGTLGEAGEGGAAGAGAAGGPENLVAAAFSFASGVHGTGLWVFDAAESVETVQVVGTGGSLSFSVFGQEPVRVSTPAGTREVDAPYPDTVQLPLIQTVVDALTGRGQCPSTGQSALRTTRVVDTLLADLRSRPR